MTPDEHYAEAESILSDLDTLVSAQPPELDPMVGAALLGMASVHATLATCRREPPYVIKVDSALSDEDARKFRDRIRDLTARDGRRFL